MGASVEYNVFCEEGQRMPVWNWLLILGILCVAVGIHVYVYRCYEYVCPKCSKTFKPETFLGSMFALNGGDMRRVRCPYCRCKDWAQAKKL